jgi:hypothetical protein
MVLLSTNGGHRITDKSNVAPIFGRKDDPYKKWIDKDTVENDPGVSRPSVRATPTMPGSRALAAGIALKKCVTPLSPSPRDLIKVSGVASL